MVVKIICRSLLQKTYELEDCQYWNDGSRVSDLEIDANVSCTSNGEYITITTSTSGEKYVKLPNTLTSSDNWEYSVEIGAVGTTQSLAVMFNNIDIYAGHGDLQNNWFLQNRNLITKATQVGDVVKFTKNGNTISMELNGSVIGSNTFTFNQSYWVGFYTNNGRVQHIKNIKVKAL